MKAPAFWACDHPTRAARLLLPASRLYAAMADRRLSRPGVQAAVPVICIGNVTVGGTGKTPTALAFARQLEELGHRPAFLTRGYGGSQPGPLLVDPARHGAREVGDEALLPRPSGRCGARCT